MAVDLVGIQTIEHLNRIFQLQNHHDFTVSSNFNQAVSALKRSGHARFRRGPPPPSYSSDHHHAPPSVSSSQFEEKVSKDCCLKRSATETTSSLAGEGVVELEGSVSNGKQLSFLGIVAPTTSFSSRKPPLPSSHRKRQGSGKEDRSVSRTSCHCCKRRKTGSKQKTRRIPIIGSKVESIPADDYSWKKYGEKKVDGSLFPRVYYKCNSAKGCPARKRVELSVTDSKMLLVTYDGEHHHHHHHHHTPTLLPAGLTALTIQSN